MEVFTTKERYWTAKEAADYLGLKVRTFYNYVSKGLIPFRKNSTGGKRYVKEDLDTVIRRGEND